MPPFQGEIDTSFSSQQGVVDKAPVPLYQPLTESTQRSVSFAPMVMIYDVENLDDYTADEKKATWFDMKDLQKMKDLAKIQAKLINAGRMIKHSTRGLEHKTKEGLMKKRLHRMGAYSAVFGEIEFQREEDFNDANAIAEAYRPYSEPCSVSAQMAAELDALEAIKVYGKMIHAF